MKYFYLLGYCFIVGVILASMAAFQGCASVGAPTGGAKDSLPPSLLKAFPENFTPNFNSKKITLTFDEYVDLDGVFEKLVINPPLSKFPLVEKKLNTVYIRINDTLEQNTTYSWRFDEVIKDVNEGNPFGNYTYVFSTGPTFDSATFSGRVIDAETGKADSTLLIILHKDLSDTAIIKSKPRYITKLDSAGFFRFTYLAPGPYNVFALKDEGMKRYSDSTTPFAFYDEVIQVSDTTAPVEMFFFSSKKKEEPPADDGFDKTKKKPEEEEKKSKYLILKPMFGASSKQDVLEDLVINISSPLKTFDSSLIQFTDTLGRPMRPYRIRMDSIGKSLILSHRWKMESVYRLIFDKNFASDSAGLTIARTDTLDFETKGEADYGGLKLQITGLDYDKNPVLVWLQGGKIFKSIPLKTGSFIDKYFLPGEYEIRILLDANQNGVWDKGNYLKRIQPEKNIYIPQKINIRANWENEFTIDVSTQ